MPTFDSKDVANTILDLGDVRGIPLDPMKLLKLLFFSHGWHLALIGDRLVNENVQAWGFGPVIPSVYHEFKSFGRDPIKLRASRFDYELKDMVEVRIPENEETKDSRALIQRVWDVYSSYSSIQLSNMTHLPGSPWAEVTKDLPKPFPRGIVIPDELIRSYFKKVAERGHAARQQA
jgi:uncharacterized phage-associated protein